jgi:sialic acid synthase SpsE
VRDDEGLAAVARCPGAALHVAPDAITDLAFLRRAASTERALWLGTAMTSADEVADALRELVAARGKITLLHGLATVPARDEELNLRAIGTLRDRFTLPVGFHALDAPDAACVAAAALGASVLVVPFDPERLRRLAADLRVVARALGDGDKRVQASEWALRDARRRSLVARVDIARGETLRAEMMATAPPGVGLTPRALASVVGRRAAVDIAAGTLLTLGMLE